MANSSPHRVFLHATDESALKTVEFSDLKKFAAEGENQTGTVKRGNAQNAAPLVESDVGGTRGGGGDN